MLELNKKQRLEKYAIIGAGPSGLAGARNLQKFGIPFDGFEAHSGVGGLWDIKNPNSTVYESAHLISSKKMTEFVEFPMPDSVAPFPHHADLLAYFQSFAKHFDLEKHFRFNTTVKRIEPEGDFWQVRLDSGETIKYRGAIIANGVLSEPNMPQFEGEFTGELFHSAVYKSAKIFEGKSVLIVGAGNTGCDLAVDAVHRAKRVAISVRRGYHFVPKFIFGKPADTLGGLIRLPARLKQAIDSRLLKLFTGNPQAFGFPEPDHKLYESHPIVNSLILYHLGHGDLEVKPDVARFAGDKVIFKDGSEAQFDLVLLATGYKLHYPFMDQELLCWNGAKPELYLQCFHPKYDNLFVLGMLEAAGIGWQGRYAQAELLARFIVANQKGTKAAAAFKKAKQGPQPDLNGGYNYLALDRMAFYVHKHTYLAHLNKHIRRFKKEART
jgi:cation diffusion facilitator CzcD-associated flavoprotein CzcO